MKLKTLLVDDHRLVREGLKRLIEEDERIKVIGEASDGRTAIELAQALRPDVVILDVTMPGLNGIEAARALAGLESPPRVLALSMHADAQFVEEMFKAGACGYLLKDAAADDLVAAVHAVAMGKVYLGEAVAGTVVRACYRNGAPQEQSGVRRLTPRERQVLPALAEGLTTKQIGLSLKISAKTVETHRRQVMDKLGMYSIAQLTKYAVREGLTPLGA
jgi:DNA-binding NarL/FixJ family response regulator